MSKEIIDNLNLKISELSGQIADLKLARGQARAALANLQEFDRYIIDPSVSSFIHSVEGCNVGRDRLVFDLGGDEIYVANFCGQMASQIGVRVSLKRSTDGF